MARIRDWPALIFLSSALAVMGSLISIVLVNPIVGAVSAVWPDFHPDARTSIALDAAARELVDHRQPGIASRFANFLNRALRHDLFTAVHFDPGRMPA